MGTSADPTGFRKSTGYMPIEHHGLIGNMRTAALVAIDGGLDMMCWPEFDSPSVFCRMLDKDKGGHFTINPPNDIMVNTKQQYLPNNNILQTRFLHENGVLNLTDFFPRPVKVPDAKAHQYDQRTRTDSTAVRNELKQWLVRRAECIRGEIEVEMEIMPAFNYARDQHTTELVMLYDADDWTPAKVIFKSKDLALQLNVVVDYQDESKNGPSIKLQRRKGASELGDAVFARISLKEGQAVSFVLRDLDDTFKGRMTTTLVDELQSDTSHYWFNWISRSKFKGRWREVVSRGLMILKMLTYESTGAIIASPTFSLPEAIGGSRNWDYRFTWVRDASFTIYILLRVGFTEEAAAYMKFMSERLQYSRLPDGALPIMFSIRGSIDIPEITLDHLDGYRGSKPVRIGNGAATHKQLDIYGELMDAIYLYNKFGAPISYDSWVTVRQLTNFICTIWNTQDVSIWESRGTAQHFTYSKIMLWVAVDRALRLADKRCFPCPDRLKWLSVRDQICDQVMEKGYNKDIGAFIQSYEANDVLDSALLIAPLVFFIAPNDPRFLSTLSAILRPPEKGGLTSTGLVYRYDFTKSDDGVGGREGTFSICTFWLIEALTRAGAYDKKYLIQAINFFENMLGFANHLSMFREEIAHSGEQLGNTPQAFSHLACISAAFNLDRVTSGEGGM